MSLPLHFIFAATVLFGVFFRFYHADLKLYSPEEVATSLFVSGHVNADVDAALSDGHTHGVADLRALLTPGKDASAAATWHALWLEHPQHPPLYFELAIEPGLIAGGNVFLRRLPAILFGILEIGAAGWFAFRLTRNSAIAWCMAALVAVSPFHVAYSQENREYSLFTMLICLSSGLLIATLEDGRLLRFILYGLTIGLGMWTFTAFAIVVAAHAAYIVLPRTGFAGRRRLYAGVALVAGAMTFLPWVYVLATRAGVAANDMGWEGVSLPASLYAGKWLFNLGSVFFDLDYLSLALVPLAVLAIAIGVVASWTYLRSVPVRVWALPALLGGLTLLVTLVPDLLRHETRALQSRYLTTLWLALEFATAGGICAAFARATAVRLRIWQAGLATLLILGIVSDAVGAQARTWWNTGSARNRVLPAIIDRLRTEPSPTVVYIDYKADVLMFERGAGDAITFRLDDNVAEALRSAPHPYAILSPAEATSSNASARLTSVPLDLTFEMQPDPAIARLRHQGKNARGGSQLELNPVLFTDRKNISDRRNFGIAYIPF